MRGDAAVLRPRERPPQPCLRVGELVVDVGQHVVHVRRENRCEDVDLDSLAVARPGSVRIADRLRASRSRPPVGDGCRLGHHRVADRAPRRAAGSADLDCQPSGTRSPLPRARGRKNPTAIRGFVRNPSTADTAITAALANTNRFASVSDRMGVLMRADSPTMPTAPESVMVARERQGKLRIRSRSHAGSVGQAVSTARPS